jgi:hypothetical protein
VPACVPACLSDCACVCVRWWSQPSARQHVSDGSDTPFVHLTHLHAPAPTQQPNRSTYPRAPYPLRPSPPRHAAAATAPCPSSLRCVFNRDVEEKDWARFPWSTTMSVGNLPPPLCLGISSLMVTPPAPAPSAQSNRCTPLSAAPASCTSLAATTGPARTRPAGTRLVDGWQKSTNE